MHPVTATATVRRYVCHTTRNMLDGTLVSIPWRGSPPVTPQLMERIGRNGGGQALVGTVIEVQATRHTLTLRVDGAPPVAVAMVEAFHPYTPSLIRPWVHLSHQDDCVSLRGW